MHPKLKGLPFCHVVSVVDADDRHEHMKNLFAEYEIENFIIHAYNKIPNSQAKIVQDDGLLISGSDKLLSEATSQITIGPSSSHLLTIKWWYENTDEEMAIFFEDDIDFDLTKYWNFNFENYIKKFGVHWDALQLSLINDGILRIFPRTRETLDWGLQAYVLKRHYAKRLIDFYFKDDNTIMFERMPNQMRAWENIAHGRTTENVILGHGNVYVHPIFNHSHKFIYNSTVQKKDASNKNVAHWSYDHVRHWWYTIGYKATLDDLFDENWYYYLLHKKDPRFLSII